MIYFFTGYHESIREKLHDIALLQNLQMARLCEITGKF